MDLLQARKFKFGYIAPNDYTDSTFCVRRFNIQLWLRKI